MALGTMRRTAFRVALAADEMPVGSWAKKHGISYSHLTHVLAGGRSSHKLDMQIDRYVAATLVPFCRNILAKLDQSNAA